MGTMLGAYDVRYMPRTAIKGQVLADFVMEFTECMADDRKGIVKAMMLSISAVVTWEMYTDGVANQKGSGIGIVLITSKKLVMEKSLRLGFLATNNEAEYETLLVGMAMVKKLGEEVVEVYSDSRLVVRQVNGEFECMQGYLVKFRQAQSHFKSFTLRQISRGQNSHANSLAMLATSLGSNLPQVIIVEDMVHPNFIKKPLVGVHSI